MDYIKLSARLGLVLSEAQRRSGLYLERAGQRFCVDFGVDNAVDKARAHRKSKRRSASSLGRSRRA